MLRLFVAIFCISATTTSFGQPITLPSGQHAVLASYYELRGCRALAAPRLQLTQRPNLGSATIVTTQARVNPGGACPPQVVPVAQVIYQARQPGHDNVAWHVRYQDRARALQNGAAEVRVLP